MLGMSALTLTFMVMDAVLGVETVSNAFMVRALELSGRRRLLVDHDRHEFSLGLFHFIDLLLVSTAAITILAAPLRIESLNDYIECFLVTVKIIAPFEILCATHWRLNHRMRLPVGSVIGTTAPALQVCDGFCASVRNAAGVATPDRLEKRHLAQQVSIVLMLKE